jgi:hypothetical protein
VHAGTFLISRIPAWTWEISALAIGKESVNGHQPAKT